MTQCTNADLGRVLGLSHSTVSRMRSGSRTGSIATLQRLSKASGVPLEDVANAAQAARRGKKSAWNKILEKACNDDDQQD